MKTIFTNFSILLVSLLASFHSVAQMEVIHGAESSTLEFLGTTGILSNKIDAKPTTRADASRSSVSPFLVFDGIDEIQTPDTNVPDVNGDVSPDHYFQVTNGQGGSIFQVFDKTGVSVYAPTSLNIFWQSFNVSGLGSPIVLWDQGAGRWLISERGGSSPKSLLVAVSMTSNPLGNWYAYQLEAPEIPNTPKYSVWSDAYYLTTKESSTGSNDPKIPVYALDRSAMLNGASEVAVQRVGIPQFETLTNVLQVGAPADWDGAISPPPAGSPFYVLRMYDDAWGTVGSDVDKLQIWEINLDWENENNTTVTGPIELLTEPFESDVCDGNIFNCLTQSNGVGISPQMEVIMHRVNYRNFGSHETMVLNHVVDADEDNLAGIKWYELRKMPGVPWEIFQEGTVSFDDQHRFIGSIAVDAAGSIALGYSLMSESKDLSLAFTGRKAGDAIGEMTVDEYEFAPGQSAFDNYRWGNYSMMSVDETDGRTFWFTGEYMKENGQWGTKITTFQVHRDSSDIGPFKIIKPIDSPYLTTVEAAEIQIKNYGLAPQSDFIVSLFLNDVLLETNMVTDTIQPDSTLNINMGYPIDMSALGAYDFKVSTTLPGDQNSYNDTLRQLISRTIRLDAAITGFAKTEMLVCDTFANVGIILTNLGPDTLWTTTIDWQYNGGIEMSYDWSGVLETDQSDTIYVVLDPLLNGANTINAGTSNPNGLMDENMMNDVLSRNFEVEMNGEKIALHLRTDLHPTETSWRLTDEWGTVIYEGGSYTAPYTEYIEELCLIDGCYTFTILDSWVDGLTAGSPDGAYHLEDEAGHILATIMDTAFIAIENNDFCLPFACTLSSEVNAVVETESDADDGAIHIIAAEGIPPYQYSIDGGMSYHANSTFTNLSGNIYNVVVMDANGCTSEQEVAVITCMLQFTFVATNATLGLEDGSIEIESMNGIPPYRYSVNNGLQFQSSNLFTGLPQGTYMIVVEDSLGCLSAFETGINVGIIKEAVDGYAMEIIPNPTDDIFRVNVVGLDELNTLDIDLLDATGKILHNYQLTRNNNVLSGEFSLHPLPAGIYFIRSRHRTVRGLTRVVKRQ